MTQTFDSSPQLNCQPSTDHGLSKSLRSRRLRLRLLGPWPPGMWTGPALRGLIAAPIKRHLCVWDAAIRDQLYDHCDGCPHQQECQYANWFEPAKTDQPIDGRERKLHSVCVIPDFVSSASPRHRSQDEVTVRLLFQDANSEAVELFVERMHAVAQRSTPGRQGLTFSVLDDDLDGGVNREFEFWDSWGLIASTPIDVMVERVAFHAASPLILKRAGAQVFQPQLSDLVSASVGLLRQFMHSLPRVPSLSSSSTEDSTETLCVADARLWKQVAEGYESTSGYWKKVVTPHHSFRENARYDINGCHGFAQYANVPLRLVRMIELAGHLGIGERRVCGAGQVVVKVP